MADEQAPSQEGQGQAAPEVAPQEGQGAPEFFSENFDPSTLPEEIRPAYDGMRKSYTQKTMELGEQRREYEQAQQWYAALSDPDTQQQALAALGYEIQQQEEQDLEPEYDPNQGPQEVYDPRVDELQQRLDAQQYEQQLDGLEQHIDGRIKQLDQEKGLNLAPEVRDLVFDRVLASEPNPDGSPAVDQAVDFVLAQFDAYRQNYVRGKQGVARAPSGVAGSPTPDLNDREKRREHMAAIMAAADPDG